MSTPRPPTHVLDRNVCGFPYAHTVLTLTGHDLSLPNFVAAARAPGPVELDATALERMRTNRAFIEHIAERGDDVYGLSTGVGVRKNRISAGDTVRFLRTPTPVLRP